ncbi:hypothetical protein AB0D94_31970 [Streptomyces sp. NPDC048255]|uniref:hypothetical protein n=1 Tax=Streptomyces sp. NPDC048255 TaxID=3154713 RepID=UPI00340F886A
MYDFGIEGYRPQWLSGPARVARTHGPLLRALGGRPLSRVWMVWDLEDDEWFCDCPVLLDFDGVQLEINHWKFDDLSLTWNTIDPLRPVTLAPFRLEWRPEPLPELRALRGATLQRAELLEWVVNGAAGRTVDLSFVFPDARVTVFNALDENGLTFGPPDPDQRVRTVR